MPLGVKVANLHHALTCPCHESRWSSWIDTQFDLFESKRTNVMLGLRLQVCRSGWSGSATSVFSKSPNSGPVPDRPYELVMGMVIQKRSVFSYKLSIAGVARSRFLRSPALASGAPTTLSAPAIFPSSRSSAKQSDSLTLAFHHYSSDQGKDKASPQVFDLRCLARRSVPGLNSLKCSYS